MTETAIPATGNNPNWATSSDTFLDFRWQVIVEKPHE